MRDLLIVAVYAVLLVFALRNPFIGILAFYWISFMNPHRYSWGFAYSLPLAVGAATVTFVSILAHLRQLQFPRVRETYLFVIFWAFITVTTFFSFYPDEAWQKWSVINKIFLMTMTAILLTNTRERLKYIVLTIIISIGFVGIKGAIFGLMTGGQYRVWGPPDSFLADNNDSGLAMVMVIPLCLSIRETLAKKWQSNALLGTGLCLFVSTVLTYSRGALLGLGAIVFFYFLWATPKQKMALALASVVLVVVGLAALPSHWFERMNTIGTYSEDGSANMRLNSWEMSFNLARDNLLGGGFECFSMEQYYRYAPNPELGNAYSTSVIGSTAHSIYFEVLATQGFIGLTIYLLCLFFILLSLFKLQRLSRCLPDSQWITSYCRGLGVSILGYMVNGAFLSRAFFDLFWAIFAAAICLKWIVYNEVLSLPTTRQLQDQHEYELAKS